MGETRKSLINLTRKTQKIIDFFEEKKASTKMPAFPMMCNRQSMLQAEENFQTTINT